MDTYKIDVTGDDILSKNAGVIVVYNNEHVYAYKLSSDLQAKIRLNFSKRSYCFDNTKLLKPRVYCAILVLILRQIAKENNTETAKFHLSICKDFDGHENNIVSILEQCLVKDFLLFECLTADNYTFVKHPKQSLVQKSAVNVYRGIWDGINKLSFNKTEIHNLISKPKCRKKRW